MERFKGTTLNDHNAGRKSSSSSYLLPWSGHILWRAEWPLMANKGINKATHSLRPKFVVIYRPPNHEAQSAAIPGSLSPNERKSPTLTLHTHFSGQWQMQAGRDSSCSVLSGLVHAHSSRLRSHSVCSMQFLPWLHHPGMETTALSLSAPVESPAIEPR